MCIKRSRGDSIYSKLLITIEYSRVIDGQITGYLSVLADNISIIIPMDNTQNSKSNNVGVCLTHYRMSHCVCINV